MTVLRRDSRTVVAYDDAGVRDFDLDDRRKATLLAGIESVVDELFRNDQWPIVRIMTRLVDELSFRAKLGKARGL